MSLRVLALSPYPLAGPSPRYRLYAFQNPLRERGIELDIRPFLTERAFTLRMNGAKNHPLALARVAFGLAERVAQARSVRGDYDLIYVHRQSAPLLHEHFDRLFLRAGVPVVFDMDDAVFNDYPIDRLLRGSVAATVGNEYLGDYVRQVSPQTRVTCVPTVVDTTQYGIRPPRLPGTPPVVGWIGTASTFTHYLEPVLAGLLRVCRDHGAEFRVIASPDVRGRVEAAGATFIPWSMEGEIQALQEFDVGVMPLQDNVFVRGKCAFKLIQYGAVGIPSVGSDIGANGEVIRHGVTGLLAADPVDFETQLAELLRRPDLGREMGAAARRVIEERFSLHSQVDVMERVLRGAAQVGGRP
ncbi:glycosyltransferase family 4 protein [Deinococcus sp. MIMF12]|uniref:Glycosyltransferase family 4 protein n=1 Tax=Deinococcus rhizophilus TaxID=3049544 RepID=A0ABT7JEW5_9DEIO|nr:glycosyltransferase family 4 protein [Deinococcus rhizophilus]MDL2343603.1 glycosyltransferase family 4 protein [Deinococcus rhizophilus]